MSNKPRVRITEITGSGGRIKKPKYRIQTLSGSGPTFLRLESVVRGEENAQRRAREQAKVHRSRAQLKNGWI